MGQNYQREGQASAAVADYMLMVVPPDHPAGKLRVFTEAQRGEAEAYAREVGAEIRPLS